MKRICTALLALLAASSVAMAVEEVPFHLFNRFRVGYDNNIYRVSDDHDPEESLRLIEEVTALLNLNFHNHTSFSIRYTPSITWYEAREDDKVDVLHDLSADFSHKISDTLTLNLGDSLRAGQLPELHSDDYVVREDDDNYYNSAIAALLYNVGPNTRIDLSGRFISLTYTDDGAAHKYDDYISPVGGLTVRQQLNSLAAAMADFRYQRLLYDKNPEGFDRDSTMIFAGVGYEQTLSSYFIGSLRGGVEQRWYDDDEFYDDQTQPYGELSLTFLPVADFRTTLSASYSIYESDISNYMSQNRTYLSLSAAWDVTSRLGLYASVIYSHNDYDADYAKSDSELKDGAEDTFAFSTRAAFEFYRHNWLEVCYQFIKLDSDIPGREEYDNHRVDLGWRIQIF